MPDYAVDRAHLDGQEVYVLREAASGAEAQIVPALGANCVALRLPPVGCDEPPVHVLVSPTRAGDLGPGGYMAGNPILFPFPSRMRRGQFVFESRPVQFDVDPDTGDHIHGLVASRPWTVDLAEARGDRAMLRVAIQLDSIPEIARQYPYPCRLTVVYTLRDAALTVKMGVRNTGDGPLPMGLGFHPWFPAAFASEGSRQEAEVQVPGQRTWVLGSDLLPTGQTVPVSGALDLQQPRALGAQAYDHIFTDLIAQAHGAPAGWSEARLRNPWAGQEIVVQADPQYREWVLYAPPDKPIVCLEPYTCTADAANLAPTGVDSGLTVVPPGVTWHGFIRLLVRRTDGGKPAGA